MLNNLKAEYIRKGITPYKGIMSALNCSEKTAATVTAATVTAAAGTAATGTADFLIL